VILKMSLSLLSLLKMLIRSPVWWCAPVVPVTQEAEAEGLLEPDSWKPGQVTQ
jgi:hypothetical protein